MEERYGLLMCAQGILPVIHALEPESIVQKIVMCLRQISRLWVLSGPQNWGLLPLLDPLLVTCGSVF